MGRYHYTSSEKELNKVLKYQQDELTEIDMHIAEMRFSSDARISESETLLKQLGYETKHLMPVQSVEAKRTSPALVTEDWEEIVQQAEGRYPYDVALEHKSGTNYVDS